MYTPIYIDFEATYPQHELTNHIGFFEEDPIDLYIEELDPDIAAKSYRLAPRYFVIIKRPANNPGPDIRIDIHKSDYSLLHNKLRVSLPPSNGFGYNASYKVSYYEWHPLLNFPNSKITTKKILEQYWYVPTIDEHTFVPMFPFDPRIIYPLDLILVDRYDKPRLVKELVPVNRVDNQDGTYTDTIIDPNYSHIFSFLLSDIINSSETVTTETFYYSQNTIDWNYSKALEGTTIVRQGNSIDGNLSNGSTSTHINYIQPFHPNQITLTREHLDLLNG